MLRKDKRGVDLKQFFIGAEGTLGIVTAAACKLAPPGEKVAAALQRLGALSDAITLCRPARLDCCDLSAFEFLPPIALILAHRAIPDLAMPMSADYPAYGRLRFRWPASWISRI